MKDPTQCTMPGCFQVTLERKGFHISVPYKLFTQSSPDWEEKKNQLFEEENRVEFSLKGHSSLHATVDIDDKNNCRPSSSKSENKHIMLDSSKQDLSSSYRGTQDSDTEDDSSTNGSASEKN